MRDNFGGCCGVPRYPDDLGPPDCEDGCSSCGMPVWSVNPVNMNLVVQDTPLWYDNPVGPKVEIHLTYNSQDALNQLRPFGNKWVFNYTSYALESPGNEPAGTVLIVMPGGRGDAYRPAGNNLYTAPVGVFNKLEKTGAYAFRLTLQDGSVHLYGVPPAMPANSTTSLLLSITDRYGVGLAFTHDSQGRLTTITDRWNRATTLRYNAQGLVDDIADPFGRHATFGYDAAGNLREQTDMGGVAYGYTYDANVYLTSIRKPTGTTAFYVEPADGIRPATDTYNKYPPSGRKPMWENYRITITDPLGFQEEYHYNGYSRYGWHRDKTQQYAPNQTEAQALNSPKTRFEYTTVAGGKARIHYTTFADNTYIQQGSYTAQGQPGSIWDARGYSTAYTYNAAGRVLTRRGPRYVTSIGDYERTAYEYAPNGLDLIKTTDLPGTAAARITERRTYDNLRNLLTVTDALNHPTTYTYNAFGQVASVTNALNEPPTVYTYNALQQLIGVTRAGQTLSSTTYDNIGRVQSRTDADGLMLVFEYDNLNRLSRTVHMDGASETKQWGCCHLDSDTDRAGKTTTYTYDALNRLKTKTDALNQTVTYDYDPNGNLAKLTDAKGSANRWEYDARWRPNKKIYADNTSETYAHDGGGNLTASTDAKGIRTAYTYDEDNRLLTRQVMAVPAGTAPVPNVSFTYDAFGRRATMSDAATPVGTTTYAYDAADRLTGIDGPPADDTVTFAYDALGRVTGRTVNGKTVATGYDVQGRATGVTNPLGAFTYAYAGPASPRLASVGYPNGQTTTYSYLGVTSDFRLQTLWHRDPANATLSRHDYAYAPRGEIIRWDKQLAPSGNPSPGYLTYDAIGQLLDLTNNPKHTWNSFYSGQSYTYDPAGNRLDSTAYSSVGGGFNGGYSNTTATTPNALNQIVTVQYPPPAFYPGMDEPPSATVDTLAYDPDGNLSTLTSSDGSVRPRYEWDALNRLAAVARGAQRSEFAYDGLGRRTQIVEKTLDSGGSATVTSQKRFLWVGNEIVREQETLSGVAKDFYAQGAQVLGGPAPGGFFYTRDHLGSVRELTDGAGTVRARYDYDPYGQRAKLGGDLESDFGFTGHLVHAPSGLHLAMHRAYDAGMGRWLSRDPIGEEGGINLYGYVGNSPINRWDPLGLIDYEFFNGGWEDPNTRLFPDRPNVYDIGAHGDPHGLYDSAGRMYTPKEVLDRVKNDPNFKKADSTKLWACSTGYGKNSFAEQFAKLSGKPTTGATGDLNAAKRPGDPGSFSRYQGNPFNLFKPSTWSSGGWKTFNPR